MQKNARRLGSQRSDTAGNDDVNSISYYDWVSRSTQTGVHAARLVSTSQPGLIRRFLKRLSRQH